MEGNISLRRQELYDIWRKELMLEKKNSAVFVYVSSKLGLDECTDDARYNNVKKYTENFNSKLAKMWKDCNRTSKTFEKRHQNWLNHDISLAEFYGDDTHALQIPSKRGRPMKNFDEVSEQTKRKKVLPLLEKYSSDELLLATRKSFEASGKRNVSKALDVASSSRADDVQKITSASPLVPIKYTTEEALALYIDGDYTKKSYIMMQQGAKSRNANIYPNYNKILDEKKKCYPHSDSITIKDISAEVNLQQLVNHTAKRLLDVQKDVIMQSRGQSNEFTLVYKWGADGSASHSSYKQSFSEIETTNEDKNDSNLFAMCLVPLQLCSLTKQVIWQNPRPSSTRYCRPIKLIFKKETQQLVKEEIGNIETQVNEIQPTHYTLDGTDVIVKHEFHLTMIDGKTFGVLSESSNQSCGICGATPKLMNQLDKIYKMKPNSKLYVYGISNLHAWIRCLECCLHISYRLDVKKWQVRGEDEKRQVKERKELIIKRLKSEMSLLVDMPKQGYGTTNDGNTARRFFRQHVLSSSITGLDETLLKRIYTILVTLSCGYTIDTDKFADYTKSTAELYVTLYTWYNMPSSLHRILIHGSDIIKAATLPIGMLSEEALESRNKEFRKYRESHTRKFCREKTMEDLFNALLISSDPLISSLSKCIGGRAHKEPLSKDVLQLLKEPSLQEVFDSSDDDE